MVFSLIVVNIYKSLHFFPVMKNLPPGARRKKIEEKKRGRKEKSREGQRPLPINGRTRKQGGSSFGFDESNPYPWCTFVPWCLGGYFLYCSIISASFFISSGLFKSYFSTLKEMFPLPMAQRSEPFSPSEEGFPVPSQK